MFKKSLYLVMLCVVTRSLIAEDVQIQDAAIEVKVGELQDRVFEDFVSFEVKKSVVFEDFIKSLSDKSQAELEDFIKKTERALLDNVKFVELVKHYNDIFTRLNVIRKGLPKVTLIFSFDKEDWLGLVKPEELNVDSLKNTLSEEQVTKLSEELSAMASSLEQVEMTVLTGLENSDLPKELKAKSSNSKFRIALILG